MQRFFSKYYHVLVELWWNASGHWAPVTCIVVTRWAATWARGSYPAWSLENFRQQKSRQIKSHLFIKRCFYLIKWKEWRSVWGPPCLRAVSIWSTAVKVRNAVIISNSSQRATSTAQQHNKLITCYTVILKGSWYRFTVNKPSLFKRRCQEKLGNQSYF